MDAQKRYREFSRTALPGKREEVVADTSVLIRGDQVVHRIHSRTSGGFKDVRMTGDPVSDTLAVLDARKFVMDHDSRDRSVRPVPKPGRRQLTHVEILASCGYCGGRGFTEDEWGNEDVCQCRR